MGKVIDLTRYARLKAAKRLGCLKEPAAAAMGFKTMEDFDLYVSPFITLTERNLELMTYFFGAMRNPDKTDWEHIKKTWGLMEPKD